jgi:hypothetical protein
LRKSLLKSIYVTAIEELNKKWELLSRTIFSSSKI